MSVLVLIVFIKRNIVFSNFNVTCVKKNKLKLVYLKKKVRLLKKKLRQKQKALKEEEEEKKKRKLPLLRRNLEIQEHAVEPSVNFTVKKILIFKLVSIS